MKSLLIILLLTPFFSQAQFWVEDNVVWHYDYWNLGTGGFYKINHTGTATIDAIPCSEYTIDSYNFYYFPFGGGSYLFSGTNTIAKNIYMHPPIQFTGGMAMNTVCFSILVLKLEMSGFLTSTQILLV